MNMTVTATPSLPESYHHTATLMYEQRNWSNPHKESWDNVTDTYHTRLRVDEHANTPDDTAHLSTLPVQTAWSENSGWINGAYVQATLAWDALAYPCVCHNFCWDSYKEGLNSDGSGVLQEVLTLIDETHERHDVPVVLIGHSMDGHFVSVGCVRPAGVHQHLPSG